MVRAYIRSQEKENERYSKSNCAHDRQLGGLLIWGKLEVLTHKATASSLGTYVVFPGTRKRLAFYINVCS